MLANQVTTMNARGSFVEKEEHYRTAKSLARYLAIENLDSYVARYSGSQGETHEANEGFIEEVDRLTGNMPREYFDVSPIQWIKSIECLEYQSCEHWSSEELPRKRGYYSSLIRKFIGLLPKYDEAEWGMPEASSDQPVDIRYL
tara:strand:- start:111 stop:542 length:432 start_codon:yes stop_codon:yes gene_type:complete